MKITPAYILFYSGGIACTVTMLKSLAENRPPLLLFFHAAAPASAGELIAAKIFAQRYALPLQILRLEVNVKPLHQRESEMIEIASNFAEQQGLKAMVLGRPTFMTSDPPPLRSKKIPALFIPAKEHSDESYRDALIREPGLFRETFSCRESFNAVACGKCLKCRETAALFSRIRTQ